MDAAYLRLIDSDRPSGKPWRLSPSSTTRIGRSADNDIVLSDDRVSALHATISRTADDWWLTDQKSTNGSFINGIPVSSQRLSEGDRLGFGSPEMEIVFSRRSPPRLGRLLTAAGLLLGLSALLFIGFQSQPDAVHETGDALAPATVEQPEAVSPVEPALTPPPVVAVPVLDFSGIVTASAERPALYRYRHNAKVYVLDFPDPAWQGRAMNRVMALVEDARAPKDRILHGAEFNDFMQAHGYTSASFTFGHDYTARSLARFFSLAAGQGIALTPEEQALLGLLLEQGLLTVVGDDYAGAEANPVLITLPHSDGEDSDLLRRSILAHELSHGEFFTRPAYREHVQRFWEDVLSQSQRESLQGYLAGIGYDVSDRSLMLNEMQAYLIHTAEPRIFSAAQVWMSEETRQALTERFLADAPESPFLQDLVKPD